MILRNDVKFLHIISIEYLKSQIDSGADFIQIFAIAFAGLLKWQRL